MTLRWCIMGLKCGQAKTKTRANMLQQCFVDLVLFLIHDKKLWFLQLISLVQILCIILTKILQDPVGNMLLKPWNIWGYFQCKQCRQGKSNRSAWPRSDPCPWCPWFTCTASYLSCFQLWRQGTLKLSSCLLLGLPVEEDNLLNGCHLFLCSTNIMHAIHVL